MNKLRPKWLAAAGVLAFAGYAAADYPLMNMVADKVIQKYQSANCEQLWEQKSKPKSDQEQRLMGLLKSDRSCARPSWTRWPARSPTRCSTAG